MQAPSFKEGTSLRFGYMYTPTPNWVVSKAARLTNIPLGADWNDIWAACERYFTPTKVNFTQPGGIFMDDALVTYNEEDEDKVPDFINIDGYRVRVERHDPKPQAPTPPKTNPRRWEKVPGNQRANTPANTVSRAQERIVRDLEVIEQEHARAEGQQSTIESDKELPLDETDEGKAKDTTMIESDKELPRNQEGTTQSQEIVDLTNSEGTARYQTALEALTLLNVAATQPPIRPEDLLSTLSGETSFSAAETQAVEEEQADNTENPAHEQPTTYTEASEATAEGGRAHDDEYGTEKSQAPGQSNHSNQSSNQAYVMYSWRRTRASFD